MNAGWVNRIAAGGALLLALIAAALVVASVGWRVLGPAPVPTAPGAAAEPLPTILASGLWGGAADATPVPVDAAPRTITDVRLLGVMAERNGAGYALFRLPDGPRFVGRGQDVTEGLRLTAVRPEGVTLRDRGSDRTMELRADPKAPVPPASTSTSAAIAAAPAGGTRVAAIRNPVCTPPAGFKGAVLRLNAELFQGIVAKPESWTALVMPDRGALVVRDDSGFIAMLAMKRQDRLEQANGIALAAPEDIVGAVLKPLAGQQAVRITGMRDGAPREWLLLNAGTCPA